MPVLTLEAISAYKQKIKLIKMIIEMGDRGDFYSGMKTTLPSQYANAWASYESDIQEIIHAYRFQFNDSGSGQFTIDTWSP